MRMLYAHFIEIILFFLWFLNHLFRNFCFGITLNLNGKEIISEVHSQGMVCYRKLRYTHSHTEKNR